MPNALEPYTQGGAAILYLVGGVIVSLLTYYIVPAILGAFTAGDNGIFTLILTILWAALIIVVPAYKAVQGIQAIGTESKNRIIGALWLIFAIIITYAAWYMIPAIANMMPEDTLVIIYWIGIIITWTLVAVALPLTAIIKAHG